MTNLNFSIQANEEYELIALGSICYHKEALLLGFDMLDEDCFYNLGNKILFNTLKSMYANKITINLEMLIEILGKNGDLDHIGMANVPGKKYICLLMTYQTSEYEYYFKELLDLRDKNKIFEVCKNTMNTLEKKEKTAKELVETMNKNLLDIYSKDDISKRNIKNIAEDYTSTGISFNQYMDWKEQRIKLGLSTYDGITSGYNNLDEAIGGFQSGKLYYCGARTSMGKTTFMLNLANNIYGHSKQHNYKTHVGIMSLEMKEEDIFSRLVCIRANVAFKRFDRGNYDSVEKATIQQTAQEFADNCDRLLIEAPSSISIEKLCMRARRLKEFFGVKILFIDYLTRISVENEKRFSSNHLKIDYISKSLQNLARELNIPIFVLAQLNRESVKKENPLPTLTDFRESGSIEEDADACILLHRPDYYNTESKQKGEVQVIIAKNRIRGIIGSMKLFCLASKTDRYNDYDTEIHQPINSSAKIIEMASND